MEVNGGKLVACHTMNMSAIQSYHVICQSMDLSLLIVFEHIFPDLKNHSLSPGEDDRVFNIDLACKEFQS